MVRPTPVDRRPRQQPTGTDQPESARLNEAQLEALERPPTSRTLTIVVGLGFVLVVLGTLGLIGLSLLSLMAHQGGPY